MAPRSAKAKKAAEAKVADNDAPKKGRGKAKVVEDPETESVEAEVDEKNIVSEKKTKRGRKAAGDTNGQDENGKIEETAPKKGRKKNVEEPPVENKSTDEPSVEDEVAVSEENNPSEDGSETNGHIEEEQVPSGRGRKKQTKKEVKKPEPRTGRGRKPKQEIEDEVEDKPKGRGRGRKAKAEEAESDISETVEDEGKPEAAKGKKKVQNQAVEKPAENDDDEVEEENVEEPKKKETKSRKNQGKKVAAKEETDDAVREDEPASKKRKVTKKDEKQKAAQNEDDNVDEEEKPEPKPAKGRRGQKKAEVSAESHEEPQDTGEPTTKRRRKPVEEKVNTEDAKKKAPPKNKSTTNYEDIDFTNESKTTQGKEWNFKIASWNVDGIRAWMSKGGLDYIKYEKPDIFCLQETKCATDKLPDEVANVPGYHAYWLAGDKDGYAGVGIYTTKLAMNVKYGLQNEELDDEGRIITAEYEQFYLICTYVPNAGRKLVTMPKRLRWNEEFLKHVKELDKKKPVIICGDMNVSHKEIDLANPKTNRKNAGFTDEERAGMTQLLGDGFVDTFRHFHPDQTGSYTFWTYMMNSRSKNVGWRLDYFIISDRLIPSVCDNVIRDKVYGSDHCPIALFLNLTTAEKPKE